MISGLLFFIKRIKKLFFFQFLFNMSKQVTVKYYSDFNVKEPYQASVDTAGHDVFAAETQTFFWQNQLIVFR